MSTPRQTIEKARKEGAKMVDVKFVDTFGTWQRFTVPIGELTEEVLSDGFGFDGSSIRGWKSNKASDIAGSCKKIGFCRGAALARRYFFANHLKNARFYWPKEVVNNLRTRVNMLSSSACATLSKKHFAARAVDDRPKW